MRTIRLIPTRDTPIRRMATPEICETPEIPEMTEACESQGKENRKGRERERPGPREVARCSVSTSRRARRSSRGHTSRPRALRQESTLRVCGLAHPVQAAAVVVAFLRLTLP